MRKSKPTFNWSTLNRDTLINLFYSVYPEVTERKISLLTFHKIMSRCIKQILPVKVIRRWDKDASPDIIYIGGAYYPYLDKINKKSIEIVISYAPNTTALHLSRKGFHRICILITDTIFHEIIHMRQHRRRKFKLIDTAFNSTAEQSSLRQEQEYLGCGDEIDAWSFNIACDLSKKFKNNKKKIIHYLNNTRLDNRNWSPWKSYLKAFEKDYNHIVIRKLKNRVINYLPNAKIGKPFKTKNWINY